MIHELLNLPSESDINYVLEELFMERFISPSSKGGNVKSFDYRLDFDLLYSLFIEKFNKDLIKDDIGWWEFTAHLESIMSEENALTNRINHRQFVKRGKKFNQEAHNNKIKMNLRLKYSIPDDDDREVQRQLGKMFSMLEHKAVK